MNDERDAGPSTNGYPQGSSPMGGHPGQFPQQQWQPQPPPKKNWFLRHKILTGLLVLVVLIGFGSALGGGSKKSGTSGSVASAPASSGHASSGAASSGSSSSKSLAPVGTPVRDGKFEFTVTKVERNRKSVGEQYAEQSAQGEYTLVYVTVKNIGDQQQGLSDNDQKAFDADGTQYSADSTADVTIQNNQVLFNQINPGNQIKGVIAFDAPAGKRLTSIEFHDSMFSGGVKAAL